MSDTIRAWHEMQEEKLASLQADEALAKALKNKEKILSDQGGEYTVPHKGAEAKEIIVADESAKYIFLLDMTLARYVQMKTNGILIMKVVKRFYMAQVTA